MSYRARWATLAVALVLAAFLNYHAQQLSYHVTVPKRALSRRVLYDDAFRAERPPVYTVCYSHEDDPDCDDDHHGDYYDVKDY